MIYPPFVQQYNLTHPILEEYFFNKTLARNLKESSQDEDGEWKFDLQRDIMYFNFTINHDHLKSDEIEFYPKILNWTQNEILINLNVT